MVSSLRMKFLKKLIVFICNGNVLILYKLELVSKDIRQKIHSKLENNLNLIIEDSGRYLPIL
jgi:hypothetical protein